MEEPGGIGGGLKGCGGIGEMEWSGEFEETVICGGLVDAEGFSEEEGIGGLVVSGGLV